MKTLWQWEKLHIISNLSFGHNVKCFLLQRRQKMSLWGKGFKSSIWNQLYASKPCPTYRRLPTPLQQTYFEIIEGKRRNCSWAISVFATRISILLNNHTIMYRDFLYFGLNIFKVVCCRFIVWEKGFNIILGKYINFSLVFQSSDMSGLIVIC